jgi:hypothetical protein
MEVIQIGTLKYWNRERLFGVTRAQDGVEYFIHIDKLSWWVAYPLVLAYGKLTKRIIYRGDFAGAVVMPLVTTAPYALVAVGVGACVAWLVDSDRPFRWAIFPAALYIYFGLIGYQWARPPVLLDRVAQVIDAGFLGIACLGGALIFLRRRAARSTRANS